MHQESIRRLYIEGGMTCVYIKITLTVLRKMDPDGWGTWQE